MHIKKMYKIIHLVLVFDGAVSQYEPVEGFCFYVVVVVLGRIFVSWQDWEINFFFLEPLDSKFRYMNKFEKQSMKIINS